MDGGSNGPHGCRGSKRLPCDLEREENRRDKRLVLNLYGYGHCVPDAVVKWLICDSYHRRLSSVEGDPRVNAASSSTEREEGAQVLTLRAKRDPGAVGAFCSREDCQKRVDGSVDQPICVEPKLGCDLESE